MKAVIRHLPAIICVALAGVFWMAYFDLAPITIIDSCLIKVPPDIEREIVWSDWHQSEGYYGGHPFRKGTVRIGLYDWYFTQLKGPSEYGIDLDRASYEHRLVVGEAWAWVAGTILAAGLCGYAMSCAVAWVFQSMRRSLRPSESSP
jgi:hypothetical protein